MRTILVVLFLLIGGADMALAASESDVTRELADAVSWEEVNDFITRVNRELNDDIPLLTGDTIRGIASHGFSVDWDGVRQTLVTRLFREVTANVHLLGKLLFLAVLCVLLQNLQSSFEGSTISQLAYNICYIFLAVIALTAFYNALTLARSTVGTMVGFMEALLPLVLSLLAGVGALTTAALFTPLMLFVVNTVSLVVRDFVLPMLLFAAVLQCVNLLAGKYKISNLAGMFRQVGVSALGLTMVIFVGIITVQGVAGGVADGIALRTAKYAAGNFIPVFGKMFVDTVEMVMGASLLLKNAIGLFGIVTMLTICAFPLIKLVSLIFVIKLAGALVEPMGDENMAKCLDGMANNLMLVFGAVLAVAIMFFLAITIIIGVGSVTMMLR